ncbi:hypothetical protein E4T39_07740 [Aureobasidium subglaciale]|nr:hypothetical protein E4T39_07740 [Aureobasidium subglaciale]
MARYLDFVYLDVFTTTPFKGNPLAIVHLPSPTSKHPALTQAQKQAIARELNLSETVFVHGLSPDRKGGLSSNQRKIDIFMPTLELPFAGHPTVGTAFYLQDWEVDTLVTKAGPIAIHVDSPGHKTTSFMPPDIQKLQLHPNLAVRRAELIAPIFSIVDGMNFGLIQLKNPEELSLVFPGASGFSTANNLLDAGWKNTYMARYYYVVLSSSSASSQTSYVALRTRMMEKNFEDPATGAAAAALSAYYALYKCDKTELQVSITQGVEFGRQSDISVYVAVGVGEDGKRMIKEVRLGGTATQTLKGSIMVPPV